MKKFITRLIIFCLIPMPLLFLLGYVVDEGLKKSHYVYYDEWNDLYHGTINADILIMGSSRAWVHMSPKIIDSVTHLNSYNLGTDGSSFDLQYKRFKIYLQHNKKPKYIVHEVGLVATLAKSNTLPGTVQFLPYINDTSIWNILKESEHKFNVFDRYFPAYKYNNEFVVIKEGIMSYIGKGVKSSKYKGYAGQEKPWDNSFEEFKQSNPGGWFPKYEDDAVAEFKEYLDLCKANDIKVIMVFPPVYYEITQMLDIGMKNKIFGKYEEFSKEYNSPFLNYIDDSLCLTKKNFYNSQHLNKSGAEQFSQKLAQDINKVILQANRN